MTEKHYAVADTIRVHFPTLGIGGDSTVAALKPKKRQTEQT